MKMRPSVLPTNRTAHARLQLLSARSQGTVRFPPPPSRETPALGAVAQMAPIGPRIPASPGHASPALPSAFRGRLPAGGPRQRHESSDFLPACVTRIIVLSACIHSARARRHNLSGKVVATSDLLN